MHNKTRQDFICVQRKLYLSCYKRYSASCQVWICFRRCSHRLANSYAVHKLFAHELLHVSMQRRLYLHPFLRKGLAFSGGFALLPCGIVVERFAVRNFAAEDPLFLALRLAPYAICALFSAFAAFTYRLVSSLRCSVCSFRDCQQLNQFPIGPPPIASCSLLSMEGF